MARFRLLNLRHVVRQRARSVLSVAGIAVAAALIVTVFSTYGSLTGSVQRLGARVAGNAEIEVAGVTDTGLDQRLLVGVRTTSGVDAAVPLIRSPVLLGGRQAVLFGVDNSLSALGGEFERLVTSASATAFKGPPGVFVGDALAHAAKLRVGSELALLSAAGTPSSVKVAGVLGGPQARRINAGFFAIAPLPLAQQLLHKPGQVDSILVVVDPRVGAQEVGRRLDQVVGGRALVSTPQLRTEQAAAATRVFQDATLFVALMTLAVGGLLVFDLMSMIGLERRKELAVLRALGATRPMLLRDFLAEAALLGVAGAALGCPAGVLLGRWLVVRLPPFLVASFDTRLQFVLPGWVIPVAAAACVATALVAAWRPARRTMLVQPVEAMRPPGPLETAGEGERVHWPSVVGGALLLTGGLVLALRGSGLGFAAGAPFLLGAMVLSYGLAGHVTRAVAWLAARAGAAGRLAAASAARAPRRTWAAVVIVVISTTIAVTTYGVTRNEIASASAQVAPLAGVDLFVQVSAADELPVRPLLPRSLGDRLAAVGGVARVVPGQLTYATVGRDRVLLAGIGGPSGLPGYQLASPQARAALLGGSGAVVSRRYAQLHHVGIGDQVVIATPSGPLRLRVADVVDYVVLEGGLVALSLDRLETAFGRQGATFFELTVAPGASRDAVAAAVRREVAAIPAVHVVTGADDVRGTQIAVRQAAALALGVQWVVAGAAALAVLNLLMVAVVERRQELGTVRAIGASRFLLAKAVLCEAAAIGILGGGIGLTVGVILHDVAVAAISTATAVRVPFHPVPSALLAGAAAVLLTSTGALLAARRAMRTDVIAAISYE